MYRQAHRDQRERDRASIGEHMCGVGQQRQRLRHHTDNHFADHEGDDQRQRDAQPPPVGALTDPLIVPYPAAPPTVTSLRKSSQHAHT